MDLITSDRTLEVGDLVIHRYTNNHLIHRITKIERRYVDQYNLRFYQTKGAQLGDEYNPIVTIVQVGSFNMSLNPAEKVKKLKKALDAAYIIKLTPKMMEDHLHRIEKMFEELSRNEP